MPLPDELNGKTPEEIYDILAKAHEEDVNAVRKEMIEKIPSLKEEPKKEEPPKKAYQPPYIPPMQQQQVQEPDLYTDPDGFVSRRVSAARAEVVNALALTQRPANEQLFYMGLDADGKALYDKYKAEINSRVDGLPPQSQISPDAYKMAFEIAVGMHWKEIEAARFDAKAEDLVKKTLKDRNLMSDEDIETAFTKEEPVAQTRRSLFQQPVNTPQPRYRGPAATVSSKLDEVQRKIARGFGMSDEEYLKYSEE